MRLIEPKRRGLSVLTQAKPKENANTLKKELSNPVYLSAYGTDSSTVFLYGGGQLFHV